MKILILSTFTIIILSSVAMARERVTGEEALGAGLINVARVQPGAGTTLEIAMGPTSAPHLPGGSGDGSKASPPKCSPQTTLCSDLHRRVKQRHKNYSRN
jgi:hypothetical protein